LLSLPSGPTFRAAPKTSRIIPLLVTCALGVIGFTITGGVLVYRSTQHLLETRNWVDHSNSVLTLLQTEYSRTDRVSYGMQLYEATKNPTYLRLAQNATLLMRTGVFSLETLLRDNPSQSHHARELDLKIQDLDHALNSIKEPTAVPEHEILECRRVISVLQEEERVLLDQRTNESLAGKDRSLLSGAGFIAFSLLVTILLFGFLLREAFRRRVQERQITASNNKLEEFVEELQRRSNEANLLKDARDELQLCVTSREAQECAARHLEELVPGSSGATILINNSRSMLEVAATWNNPASLADTFDMDTCCALRAGKPRWRRVGQSELHCTHFVGVPPANYICIPLAAQGDTLGFVYLSCPTQEIVHLADIRMPLVQELVELASMAIAALNLRAKLENQSIRDGLTSLFNRHFMEIALDRELHRATRRHVPLAVLMLDVDHFKSFNDTYGHEAGDIVLRSVADCLQHSVRNEDIVCRYGGEEFVIILPEISKELALVRATAIRRNISKLHMQFKGETLRPITISIGLATYPVPASNVADLLRMADRALYEAKHAGRDRTCVADEALLLQTNKGLRLPAEAEFAADLSG
jgi:diguanylate cyclase (GGDEF)-like protein